MKFLIVGSGGYSMEVADLLEALGHEVGGFFDERVTSLIHATTGLAVVADESTLVFDAVAIAVGDPDVRARLHARFVTVAPMPLLVHPSADVSRHAKLGEATLVMQNCVVSAGSSVGANTILNVATYVAHEAQVGSHCHIAPSTQVSGASRIGDGCLVGSASVIMPGCAVGDGCVVGAGSVVHRDVSARSVVAGVPARVLRSR